MTENSVYDLPAIFNKSTSVILTWNNISVWMKKEYQISAWFRRVHYERVCILDRVSGITKSGMLLAIMGASGAGKTTLLTTISQRMKGDMEGEILINGQAVKQEFMMKLSGFVPQQDLCIDSLSVNEHMEFMARLLMDTRMRGSWRTNHIKSLLLDIGLTECKHTQVAALSGGQRKRLSLAVQLLTDPPLLFCDEPTTGLDSYNASIVIKKLQKLASRGKTIICTIHQPTSGIVEIFSHVLFLAEGRVAFHGDILGAKRHFHSLGLVCPSGYNQAEFLVSELAIIPGFEELSYQKIQWVCDEFLTSAYGTELLEQIAIMSDNYINILKHSPDEGQQTSDVHISEIERNFSQLVNKQKPGPHIQFYWLTWRCIIDMKHNVANTFLQLTFYIFIALMISLPYVNIMVDQTGIQNLQGLLYFIITETVFTYMYSVTNLFPQEIPVLLREISCGLYHPGPYYLAKITVLFPQTIVGPVLYTGIIFWIADLNGGIFGFLWFCVPVILSAKAAAAYGCMMSASFESVATMTLLSAPIDVIGLYFSGLFLQLSTLPSHLSWIRYISPFYYGTEAVSILQWNQVHRIKCYESPELPCISSGAGVLEKYGYNMTNFNLDVIGLIVFYIITHLIGFSAIWHRGKRHPVY